MDLEKFANIGADCLPGLLGFKVIGWDGQSLTAEMPVTQKHFAPNGFLHAASIIALADTACGYACRMLLPPGANGFTTIELKSNHLGTARDGTIVAVAKALHAGRTTQVWDAEVTHRETNKVIAMFRCTQMVLYPKPT